jgi:hypothetical protein
MSCTIAAVNSRIVGILDARNYAFRRSDIGSSWTEARMGAFIALTPLANNDAAVAADSLTPASYLDWFSFGLKDASGNYPGQAGSQFIGFCWPGRNGSDLLASTANSAGAGSFTATNNRELGCTLNGATILGSGNTSADWNYPQQASGWATFLGLRMVVSNAGLSNQTIQIYRGGLNDATNYGADLSKAKLRTIVNNITWTSVVAAAIWYAGGVALPLPDYVFVRFPFNNTRLRIANVDAFKIS